MKVYMGQYLYTGKKMMLINCWARVILLLLYCFSSCVSSLTSWVNLRKDSWITGLKHSCSTTDVRNSVFSLTGNSRYTKLSLTVWAGCEWSSIIIMCLHYLRFCIIIDAIGVFQWNRDQASGNQEISPQISGWHGNGWLPKSCSLLMSP